MHASIFASFAIVALVALGLCLDACSAARSDALGSGLEAEGDDDAAIPCMADAASAPPDSGVADTGVRDTGVADTSTADAGSACVPGTTSTGSTMRPGEACITCHAASGATRFSAAGTVYSLLDVPNDCNGNPNVTIQIKDATGAITSLTSNSAGNFTTSTSIAMPYTAQVLRNGSVVGQMVVPQSSGDCNACHTATGLLGAPGRVTAP